LEPVTLLPSELTEVLGVPEDALVLDPQPMKTRDGDLIVLVRDALTLNEAAPDFPAMTKFCRRHRFRGLSMATVHTLAESVDVQSRFFAPAAGVDEDPVTGSVHGPLGAYVVEHGFRPTEDGRAILTCVQGRPGARAGLVRVLIDRSDRDHVAALIGGQAVTSMTGSLAE
jgi:PhzF family phenazine biosynthesis protein